MRNYNLIKQLIKQTGAEISVFCIESNIPEFERDALKKTVGSRLHIVPSRPRTPASFAKSILWDHVPPYMNDFKASGLGEVVRKACERELPDAIHIEQLHTYYCLRPHIPWLKSKGVKIVLDSHNIEFQSFEDSLEIYGLLKRTGGRFLVSHMKRLEIEAARKADAIFACSSLDAEFFKEYNLHTYVVPNGIDSSEFQIVSKEQKPILLFIGGVGYPPNADALEYYLTEIHPKIREKIPAVKLLAVGADKKSLQATHVDASSVEPLGFVDDIRPYLNQALIGICPIRYGSGTRIKIMTYMAAGLPVVSTTKGAEGVAYTNGKDIVLADDPTDFANAIIKLWSDSQYREEIAKSGHDFILKHYDWNVLGAKLGAAYKEIIALTQNRLKLPHFKLPYLMRPVASYLLVGLVVVNIVALFSFNPLYIGSFLSFIYILITPGFLLLPLLTKNRFPIALGIAFSAALSVLLLMLVGLGINTILPLLGVHDPLTTVPLIITFDALVYVLLILNYEYKENSPFEFHGFDTPNLLLAIATILLPVLTCLGAIILNNGGTNFFTMFTLVWIAVLTPFVLFYKKKLNAAIPPLTLYMTALALLLMNSMRGWYITGHDILLEYHVFTLTNNAHLWSMSLYQDPYMACLSLYDSANIPRESHTCPAGLYL